MNKLFTFGCSYTEGFSDEYSQSDVYLEYKKFRGGNFPKSWPQILSEKLGMEPHNYGEGASGNQQIFNTFCIKCREFNEGDIVIIGWSFPERYRIAIDDNSWLKLGPGLAPAEYISQKTHEEILVNRTLKPYKDELYDYENIMDLLSEKIGFKIYYWTPIHSVIYTLPPKILLQEKYLLCDMMKDRHFNCFRVIKDNEGKTISEETNGIIDDSHMGESGHRVQAELFYNHIINFHK